MTMATQDPPPQWWQTDRFVLVAAILSVVPLLWPALPPLTDLPGHIGRYHVALALGHDPILARHWSYVWRPIGNLGVDLLVMPLAPTIGVEAAARIVVMAIPPLWVTGIAAVSRAAHGRLSPLAPIAFPLAYAWPFQLGFVNFALSSALALHALAWWIRLGPGGVRRTLAFMPAAFALWLAHSAGWGLFGLAAMAADVAAWRLRGVGPARAIWRAGLACAPLALPVAAIVIASRSAIPPPADGATIAVYDWQAKFGWLGSLLRERWQLYDIGAAILVYLCLWAVFRSQRWRFEPRAGAAALVLAGAYLALPRLLGGGAYVDMRLLPAAIAIALAAADVTQANDRRLAARAALAATAFFAIRTLATTIGFAQIAATQQTALEATRHLPRGAGVFVLINEPCFSQWRNDRLEHLDGLAIARRDAFTNGQWALTGQQLIAPLHPGAEPYRTDPSQLVYPRHCELNPTDFATAIRDFDRATYRYVWTIGFAPRAALARDVRLVWRNDKSALYRVTSMPTGLAADKARLFPASDK